MLKEERQRRILDILDADGRLVAAELPGVLGVSGYTVRRDLEELASDGRLQRVHGGAIARSSVAPTYVERSRQSVAGKAAVGQAAASLVSDGDVVICDGGTTALALVDSLRAGLTGTWITHSPPVATALARCAGIDVVMIGGSFDREAMVCVGADVIDAYARVTADICFLGVWSVHPDAGISSRYYEEARVRSVMVSRADRVVGLCTEDKLGTVAAFTSAPASALTHMAVEPSTPAADLAPFRELGIEIVGAAAA
jgi:DeoR/GlpR family transcriptional regulator of sugar metabolism